MFGDIGASMTIKLNHTIVAARNKRDEHPDRRRSEPAA
jgi:hypothetical protein